MAVATARVFLCPVQLLFRRKVDGIGVSMDTPVAGNWRAGIYADNGDTPLGGAVIVESGSVAKTGAWQWQVVTFTETTLEPAVYWLAMQSDENTTAIGGMHGDFRRDGYTLVHRYYDRGGGYGALTDPCPAVTNAGNVPYFYLRVSG